MTTSAVVLKADPERKVRFTVLVPYDVIETTRRVAMERKDTTPGDVVTEALRMLFKSLESGGGEA